MKPHPVDAFTLIELLTVIVIIGILAAITIPVVGKVRDSARTAQCASNLRQLAIASLAYAGDNKDCIVPWRVNNTSPYWTTSLLPYISAKKPNSGEVDNTIFLCPVEKPNKATPPATFYVEDRVRIRYSINLHITDGGGNWERVGAKYSQIEYPSKTYLFIDLFGAGGGGRWLNDALVYPHREKVNVAFVDGHIAAKNKTRMDYYSGDTNHVFWRGFQWPGRTLTLDEPSS
ncbi:MAG: type II secretion system GspH family protein [Opitutaceae bacterium]|jgi:general secretion pathway protein G|nr:type II secretion system GspH family protein [Opitutaceae bacterium]